METPNSSGKSRAGKTIDLIIAVFVFSLVALVFTNVVLRYMAGSGINAAEEISRILFVWITFVGAAVAFRHNEHLGYDTFVRKLPDRYQAIVRLAVSASTILILVIIIFGAVKLGYLGLHTKSPATSVPLSIFYVPILIMSAYMISIEARNMIRALGQAVRSNRGGRKW